MMTTRTPMSTIQCDLLTLQDQQSSSSTQHGDRRPAAAWRHHHTLLRQGQRSETWTGLRFYDDIRTHDPSVDQSKESGTLCYDCCVCTTRTPCSFS